MERKSGARVIRFPYQRMDPANRPQTIAELKLSLYVEKLLERAGITTVEQLLAMTPDELRSIKRVGSKSLREIESVLEMLR